MLYIWRICCCLLLLPAAAAVDIHLSINCAQVLIEMLWLTHFGPFQVEFSLSRASFNAFSGLSETESILQDTLCISQISSIPIVRTNVPCMSFGLSRVCSREPCSNWFWLIVPINEHQIIISNSVGTVLFIGENWDGNIVFAECACEMGGKKPIREQKTRARTECVNLLIMTKIRKSGGKTHSISFRFPNECSALATYLHSCET